MEISKRDKKFSKGYLTRQADQIWAMGLLAALSLRDGAYLLYGSPAIVYSKNNLKRLKMNSLNKFYLLYDWPPAAIAMHCLLKLKTSQELRMLSLSLFIQGTL